MYKGIIKQILDTFLATIFLILTFPTAIIVFIILLFNNKGLVFFTQIRAGKNEKPIKIIKFRTLHDKYILGILPPDQERSSPIGNFLRKTHLDELPQLFSVIKGDLSLVGPRPLLLDYLPHYDRIAKIRNKVQPGMAGLVQIMGGNELDWSQRFYLDKFYVEHISLGFDLMILRKTITKSLINIFIEKQDDAVFSISYLDYVKIRLAFTDKTKE